MRTCESSLSIMMKMKNWHKWGSLHASLSNFAPITLRNLSLWRNLPIITSRKVLKVKRQWFSTKSLPARSYTTPFIKREQKVYRIQAATTSCQNWANRLPRIWSSYQINLVKCLKKSRLSAMIITLRNKVLVKVSTRKPCQNLMIILWR